MRGATLGTTTPMPASGVLTPLPRRLVAPRPVATAASASAPAAAAKTAFRTVTVDLGPDRAYPIHIGTGLIDRGDLLVPHIKGGRALVVTNETVGPLYLERLTAALTAPGGGLPPVAVDAVVLPDGEQYKDMGTLMKVGGQREESGGSTYIASPRSCNLDPDLSTPQPHHPFAPTHISPHSPPLYAQVWDAALAGRHARDTTFIALGGGVVGDMTGFAAAAYQRGVNFIQVPTTVMAAVDSSVGGKTGVNHPAGKNMLGAFWQPEAVLVDIDALDTLPDREYASGMSEVVKYGLIRDAPLFEWLEANAGALLARDKAALAHAIEASCLNKAAVVAADEREGGVRATLNLGHTFGHAVETASGYGAWLHGEAVSAGTAMAVDLSARLGWIEPGLAGRAVGLLEAFSLPVAPPPGMTRAQFRDLMALDKKVAAGKLRLILLRGALGGCVVTGDFGADKLEETLAAFCKM